MENVTVSAYSPQLTSLIAALAPAAHVHVQETCPVKLDARDTLNEKEETFFLFFFVNSIYNKKKMFTAKIEAKQPFYLHFFNRNKSCLCAIYVPKVPLTVFESILFLACLFLPLIKRAKPK